MKMMNFFSMVFFLLTCCSGSAEEVRECDLVLLLPFLPLFTVKLNVSSSSCARLLLTATSTARKELSRAKLELLRVSSTAVSASSFLLIVETALLSVEAALVRLSISLMPFWIKELTAVLPLLLVVVLEEEVSVLEDFDMIVVEDVVVDVEDMVSFLVLLTLIFLALCLAAFDPLLPLLLPPPPKGVLMPMYPHGLEDFLPVAMIPLPWRIPIPLEEEEDENEERQEVEALRSDCWEEEEPEDCPAEEERRLAKKNSFT